MPCVFANVRPEFIAARLVSKQPAEATHPTLAVPLRVLVLQVASRQQNIRWPIGVVALEIFDVVPRVVQISNLGKWWVGAG